MAIIANEQALASDVVNGANMPSGAIIIWTGTIVNIPTGWLICDGNNSTPNLLTRFLEGVATAATNPGATGGAKAKTTAGHKHTGPNHTHTGPSHAHTGPSHTHDANLGASEGGRYAVAVSDLWTNPGSDQHIMKTNPGPDGQTIYKLHSGVKAAGTGATGVNGTGNTGAGGTGNTGNKTDSIADIRPLAISF